MTKHSTLVLPLSLLFAVHLIVFGWFSMTIERRVSPDSMNYISVARNAISGDGFVQSAPGYNQPTFWAEHFSADAPRKTRSTHNVGYSLVIAAIAIVVRLEASDAAFLLSATAYGVALVAAFFFARRLWDFEAGLLAAGTLAIALRREFLYARTDPIAIALFLVMLALLAQRVTYRRAATAGVLAGCVLLVRGAGMAPVALLGAVACLLATEHRGRLLLLYAVGVLLPLPGGSVGNGQVYPTQLSSVSTYTSQTSLAQLVANFGEATIAMFVLLALVGALAWRRVRNDGAPLVQPEARTGALLAAIWIGGYSVFLVVARLVVVIDDFEGRLVRPLLAVVVLCCAGLFWRALAQRWRSLVATTVFIVSMLVNIGYNVTLAATGYDRSDAARIVESARRSWIARHTGPDDFVIGQQVQELPYFIRHSPDVASFSDAPYYPHIREEQFNALFQTHCTTHDHLYLLLRRLEGNQAANDEVARSGVFVASLLDGRPATNTNYRLAVNLSDALIYRYTGCPS